MKLRTILAVVGFTSLLAGPVFFATHAQISPSPKRNIPSGLVEKALHSIPTCIDAGRCPDEEHLLLSTMNPRALGRVVQRGCRIRHRLKDSTVLRCPLGTSLYQARPERMFRVQGWISSNQVRAITVQQTGVVGAGVKVAVLDTGVDATHPELQGRIVSRTSFTESDGEDHQGHGTHVAGIIVGQGIKEIVDGGETNSARGVSPGASLLVGQICDEQGWCSEGDIMRGIEWAVDQGADVINLSLGSGLYTDHCDTDPLAAKVNWAVDQGVSVVAGAGNGGEYGEGVLAPACASKAIAVGAVDHSDVRPVWSSYGKAIDIVAPGVGVLSIYPCAVAGTCPEPAYWKGYGTSMATPHVAGAVALLKEEFPNLTPGDLYAALTLSAYDLESAGFDPETGYGRLDSEAARALVQSGWLPKQDSPAEPSSPEPSPEPPPSEEPSSPPPPSEEPTLSPSPPPSEEPSFDPSESAEAGSDQDDTSLPPSEEPTASEPSRESGNDIDAEADIEVEVEVDSGQGVRGRGEVNLGVGQGKGRGKGPPNAIREFLRNFFR
ncbi:S8 family peptidase [Candidatus Peregrinibacteria bacterium]|nr:S8 family peptidase [Candidatus Peregrinibacteria bacterium]